MSSKEVTTNIYVEKLSNLKHHDDNPRIIKTKKHKELMESLKSFPEMKLLREIIVDENLVILAGDKRVYALVELGYTDVTVKQVFNLSDAKKREFIAKDNIHNGEWDPDKIANDWDSDLLKKWGVPEFKVPGSDGKKDVNFRAQKEVECPECHNVFPVSESANNE